MANKKMVLINRDRLLAFKFEGFDEEHVFFYNSLEEFRHQFGHDEDFLKFKMLRDEVNIKLIVIIKGGGIVPFQKIYKYKNVKKKFDDLDKRR